MRNQIVLGNLPVSCRMKPIKIRTMRPLRVAICGFAATVALGSTALYAQSSGHSTVENSQAGGPAPAKLELFPAQVDISPGGESVTVQVLMHNTAKEAITKAKLTWPSDMSNLSVNSVPASSTPVTIDGNSDAEWTVTIQKTAPGSVSPQLPFIVNYSVGPRQLVAHMPLELTIRDITQIADVTIMTTVSALDQQHPNRIYIVIDNKSDRVITLSDVTSGSPDFISLSSEFEETRAIGDKVDKDVKMAQADGLKLYRSDLEDKVRDEIKSTKEQIKKDNPQAPDDAVEARLLEKTEQMKNNVMDKVVAAQGVNQQYQSVLQQVIDDILEMMRMEDSAKKNWIFAPHQMGYVPILVEASDRVQPGKHLLVFDVTFLWGEPKTAQPRDLVRSTEVDVQVLGESTVLKLLVLPSSLLLPGFLALSTWGFLWGLDVGKPNNAAKPNLRNALNFSQSLTDRMFWVAGITLSIAGLAIAHFFGHDVLGTYGLIDLIWVWMISVVLLGFILYGLIISLLK
jgi:hypothetical protein